MSASTATPQITLTFPDYLEFSTGFGPPTRITPNDNELAVRKYLQVIADTINKRIGNPTDKTIVIAAPPALPSTVEYPIPFPPFKMQYPNVCEEAFTLAALGQLAAGINAVWNG
jgi:hypothetical protein